MISQSERGTEESIRLHYLDWLQVLAVLGVYLFLAVHYERARAAITDKQVMEKMSEIIDVMKKAIHLGLAGTEYANRILGYQSGNFQAQMENRRLIDGGVLNQIIMYTTALMESKSAMGLIVAAPTAGACGGLPGACIGAASAMGFRRKK